jgi:hypothetical protein
LWPHLQTSLAIVICIIVNRRRTADRRLCRALRLQYSLCQYIVQLLWQATSAVKIFQELQNLGTNPGVAGQLDIEFRLQLGKLDLSSEEFT